MNETYKKYGPTFVVLFLIYVSYLILKPFIMPIIGAAIIAYLCYPIYKLLLRFIKNKIWSSVLMLFIIFILLFVPLFYITKTLIREIPFVYSSIIQALRHTSAINDLLADFSLKYGITIELQSILGNIASRLLVFLQNFLVLIPERILNISISALMLFFFFKDGDIIVKNLIKVLPFGIEKSKKIFNDVKMLTDAVVYGQLITAIIQFFLCFATYTFAGIKGPLFWATITFFFSLIPMVGPAVIYIPLSLTLIFNGVAQSQNIILFKGIFLLLFGLGIISSVDNIVKPLVISDKVKLHPAIIIISVIGGITSFGVIGLILGPLILVLLITIFRSYEFPSFDK